MAAKSKAKKSPAKKAAMKRRSSKRTAPSSPTRAPAATPAAATRAAATRAAVASGRVGDVTQILDPRSLSALRAAWNDPTAQANFKLKMGTALVSIYPGSKVLLEAVRAVFYGPMPPDEPSPTRSLLSEQDRERCIIALLAGREANSNVGLHMYLALMLEVSPAEIGHILLLAGLYGGIPGFTDSVQIEQRLLWFLADRFDPANPAQAVKSIAPDQMFDEMFAELDG